MNITFKKVSSVISTIALLSIIAHLIWPKLSIDSITITLLIIGIVPWIIPFVKSLEIPNVLKIETSDVEQAVEKIDLKGEMVKEMASRERIGGEDFFKNLENVTKADPNLALVGFRIELEKRISTVYEKILKKNRDITLMQMVSELQNKKIIHAELAAGMKNLVQLGNKAAHGYVVSSEAADLMLYYGPKIFAELNKINS